MTTTQRIAIEEATAAQLRTFARMALGLDIHDKENKPTIEAKLETAGYHARQITIMAEPDAAGMSMPEISGGAAPYVHQFKNGVKKTFVNIRLFADPQNPNQKPLFLGHNGISLYVPFGKAVALPVQFLNCLDDAVQKLGEWDRDSETGGVVWRDVQSYPYQFLPSDAVKPLPEQAAGAQGPRAA